MKVAEKIVDGQTEKDMLRRALERIIQLYTDKAHFIYELLQNAEDAKATLIKFVQYDDRLEVFHNGVPFTISDLESLCNIGYSNKVEDLNQIGEFGVGFKAVFNICETVEVFSAPEHFNDTIDNVAAPFAIRIENFVEPIDIELQKLPSKYTTKFVFPYCVGKSFSGFNEIEELQCAIYKRLENLGITTLLFMHHLKEIQYEVQGTKFNIFGCYSLNTTKLSDLCTLVTSMGETQKQGSDTENKNNAFLKFSRSTAGGRSVDIAFQVNKKEDGSFECVKSDVPYIFVYFPTETESKVDFIVQGPFRTAPNRSSIPAENDDNSLYANELAALLKDSLAELKRFEILNLSFLKCLPIDADRFYSYPLLKQLYVVTKQMLYNEEYLPCRNGGRYTSALHAKIARPEGIAKIFSDELFSELKNDGKQYCWLPTNLTENNKEYKQLYEYLTTELKIEEVRPEHFVKYFNSNKDFLPRQNIDWLLSLYQLLSNVKAEFSKAGSGNNFLTCAIVRTSNGKFVAPYRKGGDGFLPNVFIRSSKEIAGEIDYVDDKLYQRCKDFFDNLLGIHEPDEYKFFIEYVKNTYKNTYPQDEQHIKDLCVFLDFLQYPNYKDEILSLIKEFLLLRCRTKDGVSYINPDRQKVYLPKAADGTDIENYFKNVTNEIFYVDAEFYSTHDINIEKLSETGVKKHIIIDDEPVREWWRRSVTEFCPQLSLEKIQEVLIYVSTHPQEQDSILKSKTIFSLLQSNERKLVSDVSNESCKLVKLLRGEIWEIPAFWNGKWLFDENDTLVSQITITRRGLNAAYYGAIRADSKIYEILGFQQSELDKREKVEKEYAAIPDDIKQIYYETETRNRFGMSTSELVNAVKLMGGSSKAEFPVVNVKNWDTLKKHIYEIFAWACPVQYKETLRRIRTSENQGRAYLIDMYQCDGVNKEYACQMCHNTSCTSIEATEIFTNPKFELDPVNLCLCPSCAAKYRRLRSDDKLMESLRNEICGLSESYINESQQIKIKVSVEELWFTQVHIAEVQALLSSEKTIEQCWGQSGTSAPNEPNEDTEKYNRETKKYYKSLVGKKIRHKTRGEGIINDFDGEKYITVKWSAGRVSELDIFVLDKNGVIEVLEN